MVKIEPVDPDELPEGTRKGSRGRVSGPILNMFLDARTADGKPVFCARLDRTGLTRNLIGLRTGLGGYIKKHDLPIKLFQKHKELYMMRTDIDKDGNKLDARTENGEGKDENKGTLVKLTPEKVEELMN